MNFYVIIMAAGSGRRMGASIPKQFLQIGGKPVLRHTIERILQACPEAHIVTVLPKDSIQYWKDYCLSSGFHHPQTVVSGGITRFHSVRNALARIPDGVIVAVHDGVRPLVSPSLVRSMLSRMEKDRAVIPVVPMVDTLKVLKKDDTGALVLQEGMSADRSVIFGAQTPQMFRSEDIKAAYSQAYDTAFTDDASVASKKNIPITFVEGERYNIKITTPQDFEVVELLLRS